MKHSEPRRQYLWEVRRCPVAGKLQHQQLQRKEHRRDPGLQPGSGPGLEASSGQCRPLEYTDQNNHSPECDLGPYHLAVLYCPPKSSPTCPCLAHQREKIRALEPLKAKLVTVNEGCDEKILAMRAEERNELSTLKTEKMHLLKLIDKKNEEKISLQSEVSASSVATLSLFSCPTDAQSSWREP